MAVDTITHDDIIEEEPEDVDDEENDSEAEQDEFEFQEKMGQFAHSRDNLVKTITTLGAPQFIANDNRMGSLSCEFMH